MKKPIWRPSKKYVKDANITRYTEYVNKKYGKKFRDYRDLYDWSVENIPDFWESIWDFCGIKASKKYDAVVDDLRKFPGVKWFPGARLNFAENILRHRDEHPAIVFRGETQKKEIISYKSLYDTVARLAKSLRDAGVKPGDRVAAYMPNMSETAIAMLASTSIGATWASCATDIGPQAVLDRLGQIEPKVLFTVNGYYYKAKQFDSLANVKEIVKGMPGIEKVIVAEYIEQKPDIRDIPNAVYYKDFLSKESGLEIQFEQLPFDHPLYIMFSSGTTGKPKCLVQGAGGILINHLKELILQSDLKKDDVHFFITTCSWMMWNWIMSSFATGNTLVLFDGNPNYPDSEAMWKLIEEEKVTMFGTSATFINLMKSEGMVPKKNHDLSSLREIWQTGSALSAEGYEYVYKNIKKDLWFNSSAGGTDINGCFCTGSPTLPVYAGELQGPALGMKIKTYDENGKPIQDKEGELVCEAPAPSMPLYFWNDPGNKRFMDAYFNVYPNIWRHGDYVVHHSDSGGFTFYGRSDAVLKPSGVRIGTAEIYNQVEVIEGIADSLAIGQVWEGDQRVILFVKLKEGTQLTDEFANTIKKTLRVKASPRHVPAKIIAVPDIPYTLSGKKVESAITNIVHGKQVTNRDALRNPESLDFYMDISELKS